MAAPKGSKNNEIKTDKRNYRLHPEKNKRIINKSLKDLGAGRSILIDSENEIIAGNGVFEQAEKLNIPIRVIETDGTELIAVKRNDLKTGDKKRKELALMDNHTSDTSEFDFDAVKMDFDSEFLKDIELNIIDITSINEIQEWKNNNMDEFKENESEIKAVIHFNSIEQRKDFFQKIGIEKTRQQSGTWIIKL